MRSGKRRDAPAVAVAVRSIESLAQMSAVDLAALHLYPQSLPARQAGTKAAQGGSWLKKSHI